MKTTIKFLLALAVVFSITSCDEELGNIDFSTVINKTIAVHVDQTTGTAHAFDTSELMSLDNADTHDYLNQIESISINSLSYKLQNFTGDETGTVDVTFYIDNLALYTDTGINVKNTVDAATLVTITDTAFLNQIANALVNNQQVTAKYIGNATCDAAPMDFEVAVTLDITVTANALN